MTFLSIPPGVAVFLDANTLIYHFANDVQYGAACTQFLKRVELRQLLGFTSAHVLGDVAHRADALRSRLNADLSRSCIHSSTAGTTGSPGNIVASSVLR